MYECQIYLYPIDSGASTEQFAESIKSFCTANTASVSVEVSVALGSDQTIGDTVDSSTDLPPVIVVLNSDDAVAVEATAKALSEAVAPTLAADKINVLGTRRYEILPEKGPIRIHYGLRRLPQMSVGEFQNYWLGTHADVGRQLIPPYGYVQSHGNKEFTDALCTATGFAASTLDGIACVYFPDVDACQRQLAREDVAEIAIEDEKKFIDHSRVEFGVYQVV